MPFYCNICNKNFDNKATYMKHYYKSIDLAHKNKLIDICQQDVNKLYNSIKVLDVFISKSRRYYKIYNNKCGHTSIIRSDGLNNRECADIMCTGKNKSIANKGKAKSISAKQHMKEAQNRPEIKAANRMRTTQLWQSQAFKDTAITGMYNARIKHAAGIAKRQRKKANIDELKFLQLLEENGYYVNRSINNNDMWQVPYIDNEVEYIFDFYLKELDLYINIDGGIHKNLQKIKARDIKQDEYCKQHNIKLKRLNENNINTFIKEVN